MRLNVFIERMGAYERVGVLEGVRGSVAFSYDEDYLHRKGAQAISPALALQAGPFDPSVTRCFFDGLVPEGSLRHDIESAKRIARGDYLALLDAVRDEPPARCFSQRRNRLMGSIGRMRPWIFRI